MGAGGVFFEVGRKDFGRNRAGSFSVCWFDTRRGEVPVDQLLVGVVLGDFVACRNACDVVSLVASGPPWCGGSVGF